MGKPLPAAARSFLASGTRFPESGSGFPDSRNRQPAPGILHPIPEIAHPKWKANTTVGYDIVKDLQFPWPRIAEIVRGHHERADGSGYPDGLGQDELSLPVRIVALADTFDAMTSERPYRGRMPLGMALHELVKLAPLKFDPDVLQALLLQIRRDATGSARFPLLEGTLANSLAPADIDHLAAMLQHKMNQGRDFLA